jgi:hypothetical protein
MHRLLLIYSLTKSLVVEHPVQEELRQTLLAPGPNCSQALSKANCVLI